jgi:hypothetical protein
MESVERVSDLGERRLLRSWQSSRKGPKRLREFVGPILHWLQNDPPAAPFHEDLGVAFGKPALTRKANSLAPAVLEQLCAMGLHDQKYIPASIQRNGTAVCSRMAERGRSCEEKTPSRDPRILPPFL